MCMNNSLSVGKNRRTFIESRASQTVGIQHCLSTTVTEAVAPLPPTGFIPTQEWGGILYF